MSVFSRTLIAVALVASTVTLNAQWTDNGSNSTTNDDIGIGLGAGTPSQKFHVFGKALFQNTSTGAALILDRTDGKIAAFGAGGESVTFAYDSTGTFKIESNARSVLTSGLFGASQGAVQRLLIDSSGDVTIGTSGTSGDLHVYGTVTGTYVKAHYQDVAEWVPARTDLAPGTVVVLDAEMGNGVAASASAYDTAVAGVVSAQPGIILGEGSDSKEMVATTGRVLVKVDATRGPIAVGDLLVTSDRRGVAMKSEPMELNGRKFHQPGTIIGKALAPLAEGQGEILVLLSLQ